MEIPQQNAKVERKHRHLLEITKALLFHSNLPKVFWSYLVCQVVFLINHLPFIVLDNKNPFENLHNQHPTFLDFKVLGCLAFASTLSQACTKLDSKSRKCIFFKI